MLTQRGSALGDRGLPRGHFMAILRQADFATRGLDLRCIRDHHRRMVVQTPIPFRKPSPVPEQIAFDRRELAVILSLYGRMVAAGEWRDYGISCLRDVAVFAVFRRTAENPLYRIEKRPKLAQRQGKYAVIGMEGQVIKRGHDLKTVLRVLEKKLIRSVD